MQARIAVDPLVAETAAYVESEPVAGEEAMAVAWLALFDSLGCAMASTRVPECMRFLVPVVPGTVVNPGARIPGTSYRVDPVAAAFGTGCLIRWLDFSDTWVALETGHPSDNVGAILAAAELESARRRERGDPPLALKHVLCAMIQAYEIQGVLGLANSLGESGFDHATFVRVASAAVATKLLGGGLVEIESAVSHAWCDGYPLRVYRQAPNTGSRKSWAGPDAAARGVELALRALRGELPCGTVLTDPEWGMEAALFGGKPFSFSRPLGSYAMENVLFKATYPGVVHAQTALEAAIRLHTTVSERLEDVERIDIWSYAKAIRIASKTGTLHNPADPRIDALRSKMVVHEDPRFTAGNLDPEIRSSPNGIRVTFRDGTATERVDIELPLGHANRHAEDLPYLESKLRRNLAVCLPPKRVEAIMGIFEDRNKHHHMSVEDFLELFTA